MKRRITPILLLTAATLAVSQPVISQARTKTNMSADLIEVYHHSPYAVKQSFDMNGWSIQVVDGKELNEWYAPENMAEGYNLAGATVYDKQIIYITNISKELAEKALTHEMGHFFDYNYYQLTGDIPSQTDQFTYIFEQESEESKIFEAYTLQSQQEYFAQAYKHYCENKEELKENYPLTCSYIEEMLSNYARLLENGYRVAYTDYTVMETDRLEKEKVDELKQPQMIGLKYHR